MDVSVIFGEVVRNWALIILGAVGLAIATWRAMAASRQAQASLDQAELARRNHATELFNRAVEQLGHERMEVRLGAVYTLERLSRDFSDLSFPVFELLQATVRERSKGLVGSEMSDELAEMVRLVGESTREHSSG